MPALRKLAASAPDWRTRLHALWTLDGLDAIEPESVVRALGDPRGEVRTSAVRIGERFFGSDPAVVKGVVALANDKSWDVRRQVAASIGELPAAACAGHAVSMLRKHGGDPIVVDAVVSSISGAEEQVLTDMLVADAGRAPASEAVVALAAAITRSGDVQAIQRLLALVTDNARPAPVRLALLRGVDEVLPAGGATGGRGGRAAGSVRLAGLSTPGSGEAFTQGRPVTLPAEPVALIGLGSGAGRLPPSPRRSRTSWIGRTGPCAP